MTPTLKRLLSASAAAATLSGALLVAPAASATVLNIVGGNCAEYALSAPDSGNVQTLSCKVGGAPSCSIAATPSATVVPGATITLTATCSGGPFTAPGGFVWSGGTCSQGNTSTGSTSSTCSTTSGVAASATYNVVATNSSGVAAPTASKTVTWSNTVQAAPSSCSLTLSNTSVAPNTQVDLTAQCTGGGLVNQWTWSATPTLEFLNTATTPDGGNQVFPGQAGTYQISATPRNSDGLAGPTQTKTLTVTGTTGGGGTVGGAIAACSGFTNTKVMDMAFLADGQGAAVKYVTQAGAFRSGPGLSTASGFGKDDALVIVFKAPTTIETSLGFGVTHSGGSTGSSTTRTFVLSKKPCDFAVPASADALWADQANVMSQKLSSGIAVRGAFKLEPGVEYYVNVKNTAYGGTTGCSVSRCDVFVTLSN